MGKMIHGTFNGTGAAVTLCIGFVPDEVRIVAVGDAEMARVYWDAGNRVAASVEGRMEHTDQAVTLYAAGEGVVPYEGNVVLNSTLQSSTGYGEGVYLYRDRIEDYSKNNAYGYVTNPLTVWTLDTPGSRTGSFNDDVPASVARIGAGSRILIGNTGHSRRQQWAVIEALTAGQGQAADEVTLSRALATGSVMKVTGKYDYIPVPVGETTPAGFTLNATSDINVNDQIQSFVAYQYDSP